MEIRGDSDEGLQAVAEALRQYERQHSRAEIVAYRQNSASIRIRVIDADFGEMSKADRHDAVWASLENLPEDVQSQISVLLALTPDEVETSFANREFEHPVPSQL